MYSLSTLVKKLIRLDIPYNTVIGVTFVKARAMLRMPMGSAKWVIRCKTIKLFFVYPSNNDLWDHALSEIEAIMLLQKLIG